VSQLLEDWQSAKRRLQAAWRTATDTKPATGTIFASFFGRAREVERVAAEISAEICNSQNVVVKTREPAKGYPACRVG
jgi:hypothetical protein